MIELDPNYANATEFAATRFPEVREFLIEIARHPGCRLSGPIRDAILNDTPAEHLQMLTSFNPRFGDTLIVKMVTASGASDTLNFDLEDGHVSPTGITLDPQRLAKLNEFVAEFELFKARRN
jgi:hypothetical protein